MAKRKAESAGVNKSAAARELLEQNPRMKVMDVVAALAEKGIKVSSSQIYMVKSKMKARKRKAKRQQVTEMVQNSGKTEGALTVELLQRVKTLAHDAGGFGKLKELVDVLAK